MSDGIENIPNIVTDPNYYDYLRTVFKQYGPMTSAEIATDLNKVLNNSSIKRACCLGLSDNENIEVKIKIPDPEPSLLSDPTSNRGKLYKKHNYFVKQIKIPRNLCNSSLLGGEGSWEPGSENCDVFYDTFCRNMLDRFNNVNSVAKYDADTFNAYQTDCGCYGYVDPRLKPSAGVPPKCYMRGCDIGLADRKNLYLDPASRISPACSLNICNQILDASKNVVGGNYNLTAQFKCELGGNNVTGPVVNNSVLTPTQLPQQTELNQQMYEKGNTTTQCIGTISKNGLYSDILSRLTFKNVQNDISTFTNSYNVGGPMCAINTNIPFVGSISVVSFIIIIIIIFIIIIMIVVIIDD